MPVDEHPRDHLHREGGGRAEGARARALPRARRAATERASRRGRLDLDDPRLLRAAAARARARGRHRPRVPRARRARGASGSRSTRSTARSRTFLGATTTPSGSSWSPPTRPTGSATWSRTAYARLRSRGSAAGAARLESCRRRRRRARARSALAARGRPRRARRGRRQDGRPRAIEKLERCRDAARRAAGRRAGRSAPSSRSSPFSTGNAKALCKATRCEEYRDALAAYAALLRARTAGTATTCCCATLLGAYGRALRGAQARPLGARLRGPRAARARPARATTALRERYAERFAHVMVDEFQDTNPLQNELLEPARRATTCSASATSASRSTASATPTWRCSARTATRRPSAGRAAADGQLPQPRASCSTRIELAFEPRLGRELRAAARGARTRAARRPRVRALRRAAR